METPGEWLKKALNELSNKIQTGLLLDSEVISGLVSYCELAQPQDAKEYLDNIIGEEVGKNVIEEYIQRRGCGDLISGHKEVSSSHLHAYIKPSSADVSFGGTRKSTRSQKDVGSSSHTEAKKNGGPSQNETSESKTIDKGNRGNSRKKKSGKVISLAEAAKGSIVFQQGKPCSCQARRHKLTSNCLSCGKIVCEQEGEGPCSFCGSLVLKEGSTYAGLDDCLLLSNAEAAAEAFAKRLVDYDRNSAARTTVIDDQSDYYEIEGNSWLSMEEKEIIKKRREEIEEAERAKRNKVVVSFDLVGRKVMLNEDEVSELESENRIMRPADETEVHRIKPNPTLKVQPIFIDPGRSNKPPNNKVQNKGIAKGVRLEITGRVQHENNDLKLLADTII